MLVYQRVILEHHPFWRSKITSQFCAGPADAATMSTKERQGRYPRNCCGISTQNRGVPSEQIGHFSLTMEHLSWLVVWNHGIL